MWYILVFSLGYLAGLMLRKKLIEQEANLRIRTEKAYNNLLEYLNNLKEEGDLSDEICQKIVEKTYEVCED